jgi:hypothetical protein
MTAQRRFKTRKKKVLKIKDTTNFSRVFLRAKLKKTPIEQMLIEQMPTTTIRTNSPSA